MAYEMIPIELGPVSSFIYKNQGPFGRCSSIFQKFLFDCLIFLVKWNNISPTYWDVHGT